MRELHLQEPSPASSVPYSVQEVDTHLGEKYSKEPTDHEHLRDMSLSLLWRFSATVLVMFMGYLRGCLRNGEAGTTK